MIMTNTIEQLSAKHCQACEGGARPMPQDQIQDMLDKLPGWRQEGNQIEKTFQFEDFYETIGFVNVVAWIANREDHHPDLEVSYKKCRVRYSTHSIGGLSENDFICAAKIESML